MPIPLLAIAGVLAPPIASFVVDRLLTELFGGDDVVARLQALQFGQDAILADLAPNVNGSLKEVLFARTASILADTQEMDATHVPAILAAIAASGGGGGGGGMGDVVAKSIWTGADITAGEALASAYRMAEQQWGYGLVQLRANPDFAYTYFPGDTYPLAPPNEIFNVDVRHRPAGETVGAFLQRVIPTVGWYLNNGYWCADWAMQPGTTFAAVVCLVTDDRALATAPTGEYDDELAAIKAETAAIKADTDLIQLDVDGVEITLGELESALTVLTTRTVNTEEADLKILEPWRERELAATVALVDSGSIPLGEAVAAVIELTARPDYVGRVDLGPPVKFERRLGWVALGGLGGLEKPVYLEWETSLLKIPSDVTTLYWSLHPGVEGVVRTYIAAAV